MTPSCTYMYGWGFFSRSIEENCGLWIADCGF
jgi:hypothetical protein